MAIAMNPLVAAFSFLGLCMFITHCIRNRRELAAERAVEEALCRSRHPGGRDLPRTVEHRPVQCSACLEWFAGPNPLRDLTAHHVLAHSPAPVDIVDRHQNH